MTTSQPALLASVFAATLVAGSVVAASADIDLTGRWRAPSSTTGYAQIVQTGSDVTVSWDEGMTSFAFEGTFDQQTLSASFAGSAFLGLTVVGDGDVLDGTMSVINDPNRYHRFFERCECYDGNEDDGDGCNSLCRVEPCFTCTSELSICTPSSDAAVCDDRNDCTQGETCSVGACGAGTPVSPCVNLTGLWREDRYVPDFDSHLATEARYVQRGGVVLAFGVPADFGSTPVAVGTVDAPTGAISLTSRGGSVLCPATSSFDGTGALDNITFALNGLTYTAAPTGCHAFEAEVAGHRCDEVEGCDLADCTGQPDGTACGDADLCTERGSCLGSVCEDMPTCPLCTVCDGSGGYVICDFGPQPTCRPSLDDDASRFSFTDRTPNDKDRLSWQWKRGDATAFADFGDPPTSGIALCVFDESGPALQAVYSIGISPDEVCEKPPCWTQKPTSWSYKIQTEGLGSLGLTLNGGEAGKASIRLRGKGPRLTELPLGLVAPPFNLPIRTQLQMENGACFEAVFETGGVKTNEAGTFKASGGPAAP